MPIDVVAISWKANKQQRGIKLRHRETKIERKFHSNLDSLVHTLRPYNPRPTISWQPQTKTSYFLRFNKVHFDFDNALIKSIFSSETFNETSTLEGLFHHEKSPDNPFSCDFWLKWKIIVRRESFEKSEKLFLEILGLKIFHFSQSLRNFCLMKRNASSTSSHLRPEAGLADAPRTTWKSLR